MVDSVCSIDVSGRVHCNTKGGIKPGSCALSISGTRNTGLTCQRRDVAGGVDLADQVVCRVPDIDVAGGVHRHTVGVIKLSSSAQSISGTPNTGLACQCRDVAGRVNPADQVVVIVPNIDVSGGIHCNTKGGIKLGSRALTVGGT